MINTTGLLLDPYKEEYTRPKNISTQEWLDNIGYQNRNMKGYHPHVEVKSDGTVKIVCCPAKLLYGNNLYEVGKKDLPLFLTKLTAMLKKYKIYTCPAMLVYSHVFRVDYAKVVHINRTGEEVFKCLNDSVSKGQQKRKVTFYPEGGEMVADSLKYRKFCFYNKTKEVLQDKDFPTKLKDKVRKVKGTFWRMEMSMKKAEEIRREFKRIDIEPECTLMYLFDEQKAKDILQARFTRFQTVWGQAKTTSLSHPVEWLNLAKSPLDTTNATIGSIQRWLRHSGRELNRKQIVYEMAGVLITKILGMDVAKRIIAEVTNKRTANRFIKDMQKIRQPTRCWTDVRKAFENGLKTMYAFGYKGLAKLVPKKRKTGQFSGFNACILLAMIVPHIRKICNYTLKVCESN